VDSPLPWIFVVLHQFWGPAFAHRRTGFGGIALDFGTVLAQRDDRSSFVFKTTSWRQGFNLPAHYTSTRHDPLLNLALLDRTKEIKVWTCEPRANRRMSVKLIAFGLRKLGN
jgi:hypothetical protein